MTKQQLIEDNMNLVYHIVRRDYPTYVGDEDIVQCGMLGLCKAAEKWDEGKAKFSTFACMCIKNEINQEFRRRAKHQGILSLDYDIRDDDSPCEKVTLRDLIVGEENIGYVDDIVDITRLSKREQAICKMRRLGMTYKDIGKKLGISKQAVWKTARKIKALRGVDE